MTDTVWIALIALVGTMVGTLIAPFVMGRMAQKTQAVERAAKAAERAEDHARQDAAALRLEAMQRESIGLARSTHALVNNSFTESLKARLTALEQVLVLQKAMDTARLGVDAVAAMIQRTENEIALVSRMIKERTEIADSESARTAREVEQVQLVAATEKVAKETERVANATEAQAEGIRK